MREFGSTYFCSALRARVPTLASVSAGSVAGDTSDDEAPVAPAPVRWRASGRGQKAGAQTLQVVMVLASAAGLWADLVPEPTTDGWRMPEAQDAALLVGMALVSWSLALVGDVCLDRVHGEMRRSAERMRRRSKLLGFCDYVVHEAVAFAETPVVATPFLPARVRQVSQTPVLGRSSGGAGAVETLGNVLARWQGPGRKAKLGAMVLAAAAAREVVAGAWRCLHTVPLGMRAPRRAWILPGRPSRRHLQEFVAMASAPRSVEPAGAAPVRQPAWARLLTDPELMLEWLEASRDVKNIRHINRAARSFSRIFARAWTVPRHKLIAQLPQVNYNTLRVGRVRLDSVCMLIMRAFWDKVQTETGNACNLYLFCDASPTWRGVEMFASSFDLYDGHAFPK